MNIYDRIGKLEEAAELINQAIDLIKEGTKDHPVKGMAEAYTIAHLRNWSEGINPYDNSIPKIIDDIHQYEAEKRAMQQYEDDLED